MFLKRNILYSARMYWNILSDYVLMSGYIEFAPLEYYADAINSVIVNPAS